MGARWFRLTGVVLVAFASVLMMVSVTREAGALTFKAGYTKGGVTALPIEVMRKLDLPKKYGLDIQFVEVISPDEGNKLWATGQIDVYLAASMGQGAILRSQGRPVQIVYSVLRLNTYTVVLKDSPIKTVADLKGKRFGIFTLASEVTGLYKALLAEQGIAFPDNPASLDVRTAPPPVLPSLLERKEVDAVNVFEPHITRALLTGKTRQLVDDNEELKRMTKLDYVLLGIGVQEAFAKNNPDVTRTLIKMWQEAVGFIKSNPEEAFEGYAKALGFDTPEKKKLLMERLTPLFLLKWDEETVAAAKKALQLAVDAKIIGEVPAALFTTEYARP